MVPSEAFKVVLPNIKRSVPEGGSFFWRIGNRGILSTVGLLSKGFLKLQRNVKVEGMDNFLKILESKRDRGIITGILVQGRANWAVSNHLSVYFDVITFLMIDLMIRCFGGFFLFGFF